MASSTRLVTFDIIASILRVLARFDGRCVFGGSTVDDVLWRLVCTLPETDVEGETKFWVFGGSTVDDVLWRLARTLPETDVEGEATFSVVVITLTAFDNWDT